MTELTTTATGGGTLSREEMDAARERLPIVYVEAVGRRALSARAGRRRQAISGTRRWWIASSISAISVTSEPVSWVNRSRMPRTVSAEPSSELRSS